MSADRARDASLVPPAAVGLVLEPFRAFRYALSLDGHGPLPGGPAALPAEKPLSFNSFTVSRLNRPTSYAAAAAALADWIARGVLRQDADAALYVYEQVLPTGRRVRGLLGALGLSPASAGIVLPHEDTRPEPIIDRLALMTATGADLEPILVVYDGGPVVAAAIARALAGPALMDVTSPDGSRHRLARVSSTPELAAIAAELLPRQALIADGHHRYASYLSRRATHWLAGDGPGPWDFGLALLVDAAEDGLAVSAIHRVLETLPLGTAVALAGTVARVTPLPSGSAQPVAWLEQLADVTRAENRPAFVLASGTEAYLVDDLDPAAVDAALPRTGGSALRELNVTVLAHYLLPRVLGVAEHDGREVGDPQQAVMVAQASGGTAILLPPVTFHDVLRVAAEGDRMPRKSTLFLPKPAPGLALRLLEVQHLVSDATSTS